MAGFADRSRDAGNTEWQRDLSVSRNKVSEVRVARGDLVGALGAYQAGLAIAERLWRRATPATANGSATCSSPLQDRRHPAAPRRGDRRAALRGCRLGRRPLYRASRFPDHADPARDLRAAEGLMGRIEAAAKARWG